MRVTKPNVLRSSVMSMMRMNPDNVLVCNGGHNLPALEKQGGLPWIPFCIQGGPPYKPFSN